MMVLCFLNMTMGMATLFCCNIHSITIKVGNSKGGLTLLERLIPGYGCSMR
jgi:hypothetical protein